MDLRIHTREDNVFVGGDKRTEHANFCRLGLGDEVATSISGNGNGLTGRQSKTEILEQASYRSYVRRATPHIDSSVLASLCDDTR